MYLGKLFNINNRDTNSRHTYHHNTNNRSTYTYVPQNNIPYNNSSQYNSYYQSYQIYPTIKPTSRNILHKKNTVVNFDYTDDYKTYRDIIDFDKMFNSQDKIFKDQKTEGKKYTNKGYKVIKLDKKLKQDLIDFWYDNEKYKQQEQYISFIKSKNENRRENITNILELNNYNNALFNKINNYIKNELLLWTNKNNLQHTSTYGMREYTNGATLDTHIDRYDTHVISAIINISQDGTWPLILYDHNNKMHSITLTEDNDVVLYESATVFHGRPLPFKGNSYVNLFLHFKPDDWNL